MIALNLKFLPNCKDVGTKANKLLSLIYKYFSFKNKYIIIPLSISSLVRTPLEYTMEFWLRHLSKDS